MSSRDRKHNKHTKSCKKCRHCNGKYVPKLPSNFDYIGACVKQMKMSQGNIINYIDDGKMNWNTAVLIGGGGTGIEFFELIQFVRKLRKRLKIRIIIVERNGIGSTLFTPSDSNGNLITSELPEDLDLADAVKTRELYASNILEVLDRLHINKFSVISISGGSPYLGELTKQSKQRVKSIHIASGVYKIDLGLQYPDPTFLKIVQESIIDPQYFWYQPPGASINQIPGWQDRAYTEGSWSAFVRGQADNMLTFPYPASLDLQVDQSVPADVSDVTAPLFTYYGLNDIITPPEQRDLWISAYSNSDRIIQRNYPGEGHDTQYRHFDQILVDVAGFHNCLIIGLNGKTKIIPESKFLCYKRKGAVLGIAAWQNKPDSEPSKSEVSNSELSNSKVSKSELSKSESKLKYFIQNLH